VIFSINPIHCSHHKLVHFIGYYIQEDKPDSEESKIFLNTRESGPFSFTIGEGNKYLPHF
jgi:hypothetical protein